MFSKDSTLSDRAKCTATSNGSVYDFFVVYLVIALPGIANTVTLSSAGARLWTLRNELAKSLSRYLAYAPAT